MCTLGKISCQGITYRDVFTKRCKSRVIGLQKPNTRGDIVTGELGSYPLHAEGTRQNLWFLWEGLGMNPAC